MQIIKVSTCLGGLNAAKGTEKAPDRIAGLLGQFWLGESGKIPVFSVSEAKVVASNLGETTKAITEKVKSAKENFAVVGGDHFISNPAFRGFASNFENPGIIVFDAHADLMPAVEGALTHEDWLRELIEKKVVPKENVIIVGLRNIDKQESMFIRRNSIKNFAMKEIAAEGMKEVCDAVMAAAKNFGALYVSVDIDVADPAFAPGTGYLEPAGMTSRELLYFLQRIRLLKNFKGMDIVEVLPEKDINDITSKLAAKIIAEMC